MQLVKKGGVLMEFSNPNGIIFHEHGAVLGPAMFNPRHSPAQRIFHVQRITASPGVGPFIYQGTPRPDAAGIPAVPPGIEAVVPPAAGAGDVINLKGQGFARTTEVLFLNQNGQSRSAGFRVVSDRQLKVEVPDKDVITGTQLVMVVTTEGLTVTLPRGGILRPGQIPGPSPVHDSCRTRSSGSGKATSWRTRGETIWSSSRRAARSVHPVWEPRSSSSATAPWLPIAAARRCRSEFPESLE